MTLLEKRESYLLLLQHLRKHLDTSDCWCVWNTWWIIYSQPLFKCTSIDNISVTRIYLQIYIYNSVYWSHLHIYTGHIYTSEISLSWNSAHCALDLLQNLNKAEHINAWWWFNPHQGSSRVFAPWICAGSLLTSKSVSWSLARGHTMATWWTWRWVP